MSTNDYNCSPLPPNFGGRGVTFWGPTDFTLAPNGGAVTLTFTPTQPKCYQSFPREGTMQRADNVNVIWTLHTSETVQADEVGPIAFYLNGTFQGNRYHSRRGGHDLTEVYELANAQDQGVYVYDESIVNTISFVNNDPSATVALNDFRIARVYQICGMDKEYCGCCVGGEPESSPCGDPYTCNVDYPPCESFLPAGSSGNLDYSRVDYPCNVDAFTSNPYRLSYTGFDHDDSVKMIPPNSTVSWVFTLPGDSAIHNYHGPEALFFNLNNVQLYSDPNSEDVEFGLSVNNSSTIPYYVTKVREIGGVFHSSAPGADLVQSFGAYYHDGPNQVNTVRLNNNSGVTLLLCDGSPGDCDECYENQECRDGMGRIDIYRIYETCTSCQLACEIVCQNCQIDCEIACQDCQTGCELLCQDCQIGCEITCEVGCEVCETGCEVACQTGCQVSCQSACQLSCQSCQTPCDVACQSCYMCMICVSCYTTCQNPCYTCQTACQVSCQTGCQISCQTGCEVSCQTGCEVSCQSPCQVACEDYYV